MKFKTELHCHSRTVSNCASITPKELVELYLSHGYTTLVLTEHLSRQTFQKGSRYKGSDAWQEKIDYFMNGYRCLCEAAAGRLHVLLGCEICLDSSRSDYVIQGVTEEFLRANPDLLQIDIKALHERVASAGFFLYQAHPFRNYMSITPPTRLDGIEVYNAHSHHDSRNDFATLWAERFSLRQLSGSDVHDPDHIPGGGILTDAPIPDKETLLRVLREERYTLIKEGAPGTKIKKQD